MKYEIGDSAKLSKSGETGDVIARAEYEASENSYLIRYMAADGRQVEAWWGESAIEKNVT